MDSKKLTLLTVSSLEKIFPDEPFQPQAEYTGADMLLNERFSFQAAYCWEGPLTFKAGIHPRRSRTDGRTCTWRP